VPLLLTFYNTLYISTNKANAHNSIAILSRIVSLCIPEQDFNLDFLILRNAMTTMYIHTYICTCVCHASRSENVFMYVWPELRKASIKISSFHSFPNCEFISSLCMYVPMHTYIRIWSRATRLGEFLPLGFMWEFLTEKFMFHFCQTLIGQHFRSFLY
jgi:hypothetical protein